MGMFRTGRALLAPALLWLALQPAAAQAQESIYAYLALKGAQQWEQALKVMRAEVASPGQKDAAYLADIRIILVGALGDYANRLGLKPGMDEEAARAYEEGLGHARGDARRTGMLHTVYARYFSDSQRNGRAIPLFRENLAFWRQRKDAMQEFLALDALASGYNDMGELALRDLYREQALAAATAYFDPDRGRSDANEWLQYKRVLDKRMDDIARPGRADELERLWAIALDITERYLSPKSLSHLKAAQMFAIAGEPARAAKLLDEARRVWDGESKGLPDNVKLLVRGDFAAAEGTVDLLAGRYPQAVDKLEEVARLRAASGVATEDIAFQRLRGLALEGVGELDRAAAAFRDSIRIAESLRASYSVAERAAFFRSTVQRSYHGLIRVSARQAAAGGGSAGFWTAVQAAELVRARQLGDLIDPQAPPTLSVEALEGLRSALGPTEAVLYFTVTDRDLVVLAFTRERQVAALQPIAGTDFERQVRDAARALARPDSPTGPLESELLALSATVLGPVAELLRDRTELTVLPDGVLNLLPFDLLSADPKAWRPLLKTHRVRLMPSLRFARRGAEAGAAAGGKLLAVADPVYGKEVRVAGLSRGELEAATRGSRFLEYFAPLPETRSEAQAIAGTFKGAPAELLLGAQALESAVKSRPLTGVAYLHFATHGILGGEVPGVGEPALVLAQEPGEDGFLTASEVAALKLDARLAVLSACNTGSGEYVTGEGVMGLSRAFLLAGSRAVVVSLWPVASQATERLMVRFYERLAAGGDPHAALREARLAMLEEAERSGSVERHPFFWAPFVLFGD